MPHPLSEPWRRRQRTLAEFATLALTETDLDSVLQHACQLAATGIRCPIAKVLKWRAQSSDFVLCAAEGVPAEVATSGETVIPGGRESAAGYTVLSGKPVISDLAVETRFKPSEVVRRSNVRHSANVLITCGDEIYGVLEADRTDDPPFAEDHIDFLQTFASVIGAAVLRQRAGERIARLLREKELLLRELQHRVKNDLQVIVGIIGLQMRRAATPEAQEQLEAVSGRIDSLRLVHDHLYKTQALEELDLGEYLRTLATDRFRMHGHEPEGPIRLHVEAEPLRADRDLAIPLGLIANEFITNSFKHAFPDGSGTIRLRLARVDGRRARLVLEDDGKRKVAQSQTPGTGLKLIELLSRQIRAHVAWSGERGTRLALTFDLGPRATAEGASPPAG